MRGPSARRLFTGLLTVVLAVALVVVVLALVVHDDSATNAPPPPAGVRTVVAPRPGGGGDARDRRLLAIGDAVVVVGSRRDARVVRGLARDLGAIDAPALRAAGQAVVVRVRPATHGVVARVGGRRLRVGDPGDPRLRRFLDVGLGG